MILNLLGAVAEALRPGGSGRRSTRSEADEGEEPLIVSGVVPIAREGESPDILAAAVLVGGTAWVFSREELEGAFDYLFIDEAGQVCLANAVAVGLVRQEPDPGRRPDAARPADPGQPSWRDRDLLPGVPAPDKPPFRPTRRLPRTSCRMHSGICRFISDAIYDGRLTASPRPSDTG